MNARQRRKLFAGAGLISMLAGALMVVAPATAGAGVNPNFQGNCTPTDASSGTCVVDEPMGNNPATHGTVDYSRTGDQMTFDVDLDGDIQITEIQICMTVVGTLTSNPYVPTAANTCAGDSPDRVLQEDDPASTTFVVNLADVPDFETGDDVFFTLHIVAGGRTLAVTGGANTPPPPPPEAADLTIVKIVDEEDPADDLGFDFTFQPGDPDEETKFTLGHEGEQPFALVPGTFVVDETKEDGYDLDDVTCWVDYGEEEAEPFDGVWSETSAGVSVTLADGDDVTCVFTNAPTEPEPETSLTLRKVVNNRTGTWAIDLSCAQQLDREVITAAEAGGSARVTNEAPSFKCADQPGTYEIDEDLDSEAPSNMTFVDVFCTVPSDDEDGTDELELTELENGNVTVDVAEGQAVTCTFVNSVPSGGGGGGGGENPSYSVDIEKLNNADLEDDFTDFEIAPEGEGQDVEFQITIENTGSGALTLSSLIDEFDEETVNLLTEVELDCERDNQDIDLAVGSVLPANSTTVCTFTLEDYAPAQDSPLTNVVTIDTEQTGPASDSSTVVSPDVLSEVPTTPEQPEEPTVLPTEETPKPAAVKGDVVTRQLPRTGSETTDLAGYGAGFLLLGAGLIIISRAHRYSVTS